MPFQGSRTRILNVRLTDQEYIRVKDVCLARGERSISEFARAAIFGYVHDDPRNGSVERRLATLDQKVSNLVTRLDAVLDCLGPADNDRLIDPSAAQGCCG